MLNGNVSRPIRVMTEDAASWPGVSTAVCVRPHLVPPPGALYFYQTRAMILTYSRESMVGTDTPTPLRLILGIGAFVLLGTPLVAYLWETVNRLLAGVFDAPRLLISVPALVLLLVLFRFMARAVLEWDRGRRGETS